MLGAGGPPGAALPVPDRRRGSWSSVARGEVFDVAVDIRVGSPTFGRWEGGDALGRGRPPALHPAGVRPRVPRASATSPALFSYKCTEGYDPAGQCSILWDDPDLGIDWPGAAPLLSPKDAEAPRLRDVPESRLPRYHPEVT